jgi:hypothetical protein
VSPLVVAVRAVISPLDEFLADAERDQGSCDRAQANQEEFDRTEFHG